MTINTKKGSENIIFKYLISAILLAVLIIIGYSIISNSLVSSDNVDNSLDMSDMNEAVSSNNQDLDRFSPEVRRILELTGFSTNNIAQVEFIREESVSNVLSITPENSERVSSLSLNPQVIDRINSELQNPQNIVRANVAVDASLYRVSFNDGEQRDYTKISKITSITSDASEFYNFRLLEAIPKDVVSSASRFLFGDFSILVDDPLIAFDIPEREVNNDEIVIEYVVEGDVTEDLETLAAGTTVVGDSDPSSILDDTNNQQETTNNQNNLVLLIILMLLILGIILYMQMKKN